MILKLLCIFFASALPFLLSLRGDFVFDDSEAIVKNKDVTSESWWNAFNNDFWGTSMKSNLSHKSYRPLTILSFKLNYILSNELSATQFKVTNLICHVISCILVWQMYICLWRKIKIKNNKPDVPFLAALIFSVHPVHVEAVCGIVGRADLLAAITFFTTFLIYNKGTKIQSYLNIYLFISIILAGISMLFKENGVTVIGVCCVYDLIFHIKRKPNEIIYVNKTALFRIACLTISAILLLYARWSIMGGSKPEFKATDNPAAFSDDLFTKIFTYNYIYFLNIVLFIWPQWLCYDWSMGCIPLVQKLLDYRILYVLLLYAYAITLFASITRKINYCSLSRIKIMALSFMVIPFLPAANVIYPVGFVIAERILYIPSAGFCLFVSIGIHRIAQTSSKYYKIMLSLFFGLIWVFALRSCQRSFDWQNEHQLFTDGLSVCPLNAKIHYNIAKVADAANDTNWALMEYKEAIKLFPEYYQAMNNLANLLKNKKLYTEAEHYLRKALYHKKDFPAAWMNLGIVLAHVGRYNESENSYKNALRYRKHYPDCYYNLGNLYLELNKTEDAMKSWLQAIQLNSKHIEAWTNLLALLTNTGYTNKALELIPRALKELPKIPQINFAVANVYGKMDKYGEAEKYFLKTISLLGSRAQAIHYANLGVLYHRWKKYDLAEQMYMKALERDPNFSSALKNLRSLKKISNK